MRRSRWAIMAGMFTISLAGIYAAADPLGGEKGEKRSRPRSSNGVVVLSEPPLAMPEVVPASASLPALSSSELVLPMPVPAEPPMNVPPPLPQLSLPCLPELRPCPGVVSDPPMALPLTPTGVVPLTPVAVAPMPTLVAEPPQLTVHSPQPIAFEVPAPPVIETAPLTVESLPPASKYRTLLRVGDGEPVFELRSGDNILLKVVSQKVDVKTHPEKGSSLSMVRATGNVRFVGFGAEGTCEELSFRAGTGEVTLTGSVRIRMKDKLGRLESEVSGDRMTYRLELEESPLTGRLETP